MRTMWSGPKVYGPDETLPGWGREYALPSCGACLRIARRRKLDVGQKVRGGVIEAFSHTVDGVAALVVSAAGYVDIQPIAEVRVK